MEEVAMKTDLLNENRKRNFKQSLVLLGSIMALTSLLGWVIGGVSTVIMVAAAGLLLVAVNHFGSSTKLLRMMKARRLSPEMYPDLNRVLRVISQRAGLYHVPTLYAIESRLMNAFVVGREDSAAIVVSRKLLQNLNLREVAGIMGHEVAHIRNGDLFMMSIAGTTVKIVHLLATFGQILLILALPYLLFGGAQVSALPLLLIFFAPSACILMQLALSRTREFEADRTGAELAGDVYGLISALNKLERYHKGIFSRYIVMPWKMAQPSLLQTHPPTSERIHRLMSMTGIGDEWLQRSHMMRQYPQCNGC